MQSSPPSSELGELEQARVQLSQEGIAAAPRVLAVLAQAPDIASNEAAQAVLADVIAVLLDGCERGELAGVISVFADCPPALAKMALTLLTAAFFPDGKIVPAELDDSAILCFALFVAVTGQPFQAQELIELKVNERKGERFVINAAFLRSSIAKRYGQPPARALPNAPQGAILTAPVSTPGAASLEVLDYALKAATVKRTHRKRRSKFAGEDTRTLLSPYEVALVAAKLMSSTETGVIARV